MAAVKGAQSDWWSEQGCEERVSAQLGNSELQELCEHINTRNSAAQRAQRDSQILFQTLYFRDRPLSDPRCVVDAVIFSLRDNGFLVYIPQYAIKGPVYLESRSKEVLYCGKLGPTWQVGMVSRKVDYVKVDTIDGTNIYRLFDHVTVGVQLKGGDNHANVLSFSLLDNHPWRDEAKVGQVEGSSSVNFLKEARLEQVTDPIEGEEEEEDISTRRRKKPKINVYEFFNEMRQLGVRPIDDESMIIE